MTFPQPVNDRVRSCVKMLHGINKHRKNDVARSPEKGYQFLQHQGGFEVVYRGAGNGCVPFGRLAPART
jgi:hypothetical protein